MKLIVFGLSISSSWGNGHATLWRSMLRALSLRGHSTIFYEKNVPYYAGTRDGWTCPEGVRLRLYDSFEQIRAEAARELHTADAAMATSYCPDGVAASQLILDSGAAIRAFYDLDTPVTLSSLSSGAPVDYLPPNGLGAFDVVFSYTGGRALDELRSRLGARRVYPLYGSVDPSTHRPVAPMRAFRGALSYLGTWAADRQAMLEELFVLPAERLPRNRFLLAGAQYPDSFPWHDNIYFMRHLHASQHPALFCSTRATLNVTRASMASYGYCPSGRLFEAAACGAAIFTDWWEGLEDFFTPGEELLRVDSTDDVIDALSLSDRELRRIGAAARDRALRSHTAVQRVREFESICGQIHSERSKPAVAA